MSIDTVTEGDSDSEQIQMVDFTKFTHFSDNPYDEKQITVQKPQISMKPNGLWFAPSNDWIEWCKEAGFFPRTYHYQYAIESIDSSRILQILTIKDVEKCIEKYHIITPWGSKYLNWHRICQDFTGIFISYSLLYAKTFNAKYEPFDGLICSLDVDSLVIWDHSIYSLKLLKHCPTGIYGANPDPVADEIATAELAETDAMLEKLFI
ncbi:MAG: hypothetical protein WD512_01905 [Candidatus Paceibacterota bacterium]